MKQKLLFLMTLLVLCVTGAWGTDYVLKAGNFNSAKTICTVNAVEFGVTAHGGAGQTGYGDYIKFAKKKTYTITLPSGFILTKINIKGYTNSDDKTDGEITSIGGVDQTGKTFPARNDASLATTSQITDGYDFAISQTGGTVAIVTANTNQICVLITITGTMPPTLTGAWSKTSDNVDKNASAPTTPTFEVGATTGTPTASNYTVAYSLKAGSTDGILTIDPSAGITAINTSIVGTATCVATLTTTDAEAFKTPATNTFEYSITVNDLICADPTFTVYGGKVVKIECATAGATIYYGGSDVKTGTKTEYTDMFIPAASGTIYAYATKTGFTESDVVSQAVTLPVAGDVVGDLLMTLQPATTPTSSYSYDANGFVKGGYSIKGASIQNSNMTNYPNNFKVDNGADITVTPPTDVTIQSIKIYGSNNNSATATTNVTVADGFSIVNNASLMPKNVFVGGEQVMSEVVVTPNSATEGAAVVFRVGAQSRLYVEVYGTTSATNETVTIPAGKTYITYVPNHDLNFTGHAKLTAYIATAANATAVTMNSVDKVPAGTPIVLKATETGDIDVPVAASTDDVSANKLVIGDGATKIGGAGKYDYILKNGLFCKVTEASALAAGKCYLHLDAAPAGANELSFDFGDVTGIADVKGKVEEAKGEFYNLAGQRVAQPTKGLYIVNGKKVVLK